MNKVLFLVGPTGTGKSDVALRIAKKINGEIISADAMQVYQKMNIGTAKPSPKDQKIIPHHLIDLVSPKSECSVFKHRELSLKAIKDVFKRKKIPIVVGGSGFYIKALIDGIAPQPGRESALRTKLRKEAKERGLPKLYARLQKIDAKRAKEIHPNDERRIIRALEIFELSKKKPSEWHEEPTGSLKDEGIGFKIYGLARERSELYKRVEERIDKMFQMGWVNEVKRIKRIGFSKTARAAIGYGDILEYLNGKKTLEEINFEIKKRTRHFAKRQMTWFRKESRIHWIPIKGDRFQEKAAQKIISEFQELSPRRKPGSSNRSLDSGFRRNDRKIN